MLAALVEARVAGLTADCAGRSMADALEHAAAVLRGSGALRRVAQEELALLVPLAVPGEGRAWEVARTAVVGLVGPDAAELVLRWLISQLLWPAEAGGGGRGRRVAPGKVRRDAGQADAARKQHSDTAGDRPQEGSSHLTGVAS